MPCARSVLLILFLFAGSLSPPELGAQSAQSPPAGERVREFFLEQNYPNPVNPETWIPFYLDPKLFQQRDTVVVSLRVFNVLRQVVALPRALEHPAGGRPRLLDLGFTQSGRHIAYWDGRDVEGERVPSGVYYAELIVDDRPSMPRKITVVNPRRRRGFFPWFGGNDEGSGN